MAIMCTTERQKSQQSQTKTLSLSLIPPRPKKEINKQSSFYLWWSIISPSDFDLADPSATRITTLMCTKKRRKKKPANSKPGTPPFPSCSTKKTHLLVVMMINNVYFRLRSHQSFRKQNAALMCTRKRKKMNRTVWISLKRYAAKGRFKGLAMARQRRRKRERERTRRHTSAGGDALRPKQRLFYWRDFCQKAN